MLETCRAVYKRCTWLEINFPPFVRIEYLRMAANSLNKLQMHSWEVILLAMCNEDSVKLPPGSVHTNMVKQLFFLLQRQCEICLSCHSRPLPIGKFILTQHRRLWSRISPSFHRKAQGRSLEKSEEIQAAAQVLQQYSGAQKLGDRNSVWIWAVFLVCGLETRWCADTGLFQRKLAKYMSLLEETRWLGF